MKNVLTITRTVVLSASALSAGGCSDVHNTVAPSRQALSVGETTLARLVFNGGGVEATAEVRRGPLNASRVAPPFLADGAPTTDPLRAVTATRLRFEGRGAIVALRREGRRFIRESGVSAAPFTSIAWDEPLSQIALGGATPITVRLPATLTLTERRALLSQAIVVGFQPSGTTSPAVVTPMVAATAAFMGGHLLPFLSEQLCMMQCMATNMAAIHACSAQNMVPDQTLDCDSAWSNGATAGGSVTLDGGSVSGSTFGGGHCRISLDFTCIPGGNAAPDAGRLFPRTPRGPTTGTYGSPYVMECLICTSWVAPTTTDSDVKDPETGESLLDGEPETHSGYCADTVAAFGTDANQDGWCD